MSNTDNREKSKKSFPWLYWLIGLLTLKFVFPAVANMMKPNQEKNQQIEQQIQQERREQLQRSQYR
ncbi:hypothetical protein IQ244_20140 [Nostoc sp. LEGE 06077]|uniref:hypothetical protein n=1 Tax=Nostoc sp. LEGE 06077 TaxID=915325 RepID=UPI0018822DE3|nr:hypothetical protein [Nostoc sp. LEGE 06077]MBE9208809.1 hypothetical protein [Nostoc sp. LEGE 06077]